MPNPSDPTPTNPAANLANEAWSYWMDACQRAVLFLDVLRQRSDGYQEHNAKVAPHVLKAASIRSV